MKNAHTQLCVTLAVGLMTAGSLQAANQVVVQDAHCNKTAVTYPLPKGWKGNGDVKWNTTAEHQGTMCVRTMQIIDSVEEMTVHYISAYEAPLRRSNPTAEQLGNILLPAVRRMPGKTSTELTKATRYNVPQELANFRMARDLLNRKLGKKIDSKVYAVAAAYSDGTVVGAIVYERSEKRSLLRAAERSVTFHDICILSSENNSTEKALTQLKTAATQAEYNHEWISDQIRITANNIDGMPKLDEKALPAIADKTEERLKMGLPTVIDCMYDTYKRYLSTHKLAHN